ncbi:hypothetical protein [Acanthopleuribacter pedis]|uniref:Lipoprotein n=1 Tax=Acanthopleuribacter pedis TaxID=442870 RepID=A0A8J7Q126_9BACT|nr:hypothetical protein [Acanthopleuribacter pedis]MBO1318457.1 hypothetical protein [Acanthopleuribacter pedis]
MSANRKANFFGSVLTAIACTPNLNPDPSAYQHGVIEPTRQIRAFMEEVGNEDPGPEQRRHVMDLLNQVLDTKHVEPEERRERIQEILERHDLQREFAHLDAVEVR